MKIDKFENYGSHKATGYNTDSGESYSIMAPEINNPEGWECYYYEGSVPWDTNNPLGFVKPETKIEDETIDPNRVFEEGYKALVGFGFFKVVWAGHYKEFDVDAGSYRFAAKGHCWSSTNDNSSTSDGVDSDGFFRLASDMGDLPENHGTRNASMRIGIYKGPKSELDPRNDRINWTESAHIYNEYHDLPAVEFNMESAGKVTVVMEALFKWPFKHNNYYFTMPHLVKVGDPQPTPEPGPVTDWDKYPHEKWETDSKAGIHSVGDGGSTESARRLMDNGVRLPIFKTVESLGAAKDIKEISPETITVGRLMRGVDHSINVEGPSMVGDLSERAREVMENLMPLWEPHKDYIDYFEITNEMDPNTVDGHRRFAVFFKHCMEIANKNGYKLALFSYSLGVPEYEEWEAIVDTGVFAMARDGGHVLSLHEYNYPIDKGMGEPIPGAEASDDISPFILRYRWLYRDMLIPRGEAIPLIITEFNLAKPIDQITDNEMREAWGWYDKQLSDDFYAIGFCIFTLGDYWEDFKWVDQRYVFEDIIENASGRQNALPEEQNVGDEPRVPYDRTYLLLHPGAGSEWLALDSWNQYRYTIGGSADDAGVNKDLSSATVLAANPSEWGDLEGFYNKYYPSAKYVPIIASTPAELDRKIVSYYETGYPGPPDPDPSPPDPGGVLSYPTTHIPPKVTDEFGATRTNSSGHIYRHGGLDLRASYNTWGDKVLSATIGHVAENNYDPVYGNYVSIKSNERLIRYAHLAEKSSLAIGQEVNRKGVIGLPGSTGNSSADHLHIDILENGKYIDPEQLINWPLPEGFGERGVRGVHSAPIKSPFSSIQDIVVKLKALGMSWYKMLHDGDEYNVALARNLVESGITPIVRLYRSRGFPNYDLREMEDAIQRMLNVGVMYFEIGNEPNLDYEWGPEFANEFSYNNTYMTHRLADRWYRDAKYLINLGGKPAIYAMAPTNRNNQRNTKFSSVNWLENMLEKLPSDEINGWLTSGKAWLAVHSAKFDKPMDYYEEGPGDMFLRSFEKYKKIVRDTIGTPVPMIETISTEGGVYSPEHLRYIGFESDYGEANWGILMRDMYEYLESNNGIQGMCPWTFSDQGVSDPRWLGSGWYTKEGKARSPIKELGGI